MIELRRTAISIAAHVFGGPGSPTAAAGISNSSMSTARRKTSGARRGELRTRRGRGACAREGLDAAPNACVDLPFLLVDEMCKDATCISDCMH